LVVLQIWLYAHHDYLACFALCFVCIADSRSQQQQQQQFPQPPGPICRAEACLLVLDLPPHISRQEVQQILSADEAWLAPQQQQQQPGSSRPPGNNACCTFKGVL
jgi:hypothetical protein